MCNEHRDARAILAVIENLVSDVLIGGRIDLWLAPQRRSVGSDVVPIDLCRSQVVGVGKECLGIGGITLESSNVPEAGQSYVAQRLSLGVVGSRDAMSILYVLRN